VFLLREDDRLTLTRTWYRKEREDMKIKNRVVTVKALMRLINDFDDAYLDLSRKAVYRRFHSPKYLDLNDYFPSEIERMVGRLVREGWVNKIHTKDGTKIEITRDGKREVLVMNLNEFKPKVEKWDKKWRIVMFDVDERFRRQRNNLRKYLIGLGFKQYQKSVWVTPYDCEREIQYLREILEIPHEVKYGVLERLDNDDDLKKWFGI
jgi:hypothetical protein